MRRGAAVSVTSSEEKRGEALTGRLGELARGMKEGKCVVIGPAKASIGKINDIYRFVLYCKSAEYDRLVEIKDKIEQELQSIELRDENVQFDFDPMDSY